MKTSIRVCVLLVLLCLFVNLTACNFGTNSDAGNSKNPDKSNQQEGSEPTSGDSGEGQREERSVEEPYSGDTEGSAGENASPERDWVEDAPLSTDGPWFVVANPEGLYAFNMDGTGLTFLTTDKPNQYRTLSDGVSSAGGRLAYITGESDYNNLILHILDFPNNLNHKIILLNH